MVVFNEQGETMSEKIVTVTKKNAATCQLETSIKLFMENRDLISVYTLCCAADGILEGIYDNQRDEIVRKRRDKSVSPSSMHFSWTEEIEIAIKPEHRNKVFRALHAPRNFFKHADRDHDSSFQFPEWELTGVRITTTVMNYNLVFQEITPAMSVYVTLYAALKPDLLAEGSPLLIALDAMPEFRYLSRKDFAAIGYFTLKSTCPRLFDEPSIFGNIGRHDIEGQI